MEFKIAELYYPVALKNSHNFAKQNNFLKRFGDIKITGNIKIKLTSSFPAANYMFTVNNGNTRIRC